MDSQSGYGLAAQTFRYGKVAITREAKALIARQDSVAPPELPPDAPSPILVMGAMNASFVTDGILYGIHLVLFAMCCYILLTYQRRRQWFILIAVCTMFALSTADIGLSIKLSTTDLWVLIELPPEASIDKMPPKAVLFVTNNLIADVLLFHRCWVIWGRPRIILWIALICLTVDTIWGYLGHAARTAAYQHTFRPLYLWTVFALNIAVTAAAAGRIYWVSLVAIPSAERRLKRIYRAIISTLVESAAVYSSCILMYLLWIRFDENSVYWVVPLTMMTRLVAIMPTLMIVQHGMSYRCCRSGLCDSKNQNDSVVLDTVISARMQRDEDFDLESGMHVEDRQKEPVDESGPDSENGARSLADEKVIDEEQRPRDTIPSIS